MSRPVIILNLKSYKEALGDKSKGILYIVEEVAKAYQKIDFVIAPNIAHLSELASRKQRVRIFAQHCDPVPLGAYTGHLPLRALKMLGVDGTIINHSEKPVSFDVISKIVNEAKTCGIEVVACGGNLETKPLIASLKPRYVAFEPPELIGTGISVSRARPEDLKASIGFILRNSDNKSIPICGAGISSGEDVKLALEYGALGILVASAFVKAKDKKEKLIEFASAIESALS